MIDFEKDRWEWNETYSEYIIEHNFGYIPTVQMMTPDNSIVLTNVKADEKFVRITISSKFFEGKAILT